MDLNNPYVTVLMPVYNREDYLYEAIKSILEQTYKNFEFLIIDNKSTDNSINIIQSFKDERIKLIQNKETFDFSYSMNLGAKLARGKYIIEMHSDDISYKDRIAEQVTYMDNNPEIGLCGTWAEAFNGDYKKRIELETSDDKIRVKLLSDSHFVAPSICKRTALINKFDLFYNKEFGPSLDYELWFRFTKVAKVGNVPEVLFGYRLHENQDSQIRKKLLEQTSDKVRLIQIQHYFPNIPIEEHNNFLLLLSNELISKEELKKIKNYIINLLIENKKSNIFSFEPFYSFLSFLWFKKLTRLKEYDLEILKIVIYNKGIKLIRQPKSYLLKFVSKCIINYKIDN